MYLFIGLGNPGQKFENTRHNVGRETLAKWQKASSLTNFEFEKKFNALVSKNKKVILLLPETFMNNSGRAVGPAIKFFKIKPKNIIALHDDSDIEFGRTKLSFAKHSAGHKGVESAKRAIGTLDFWRLRIGIQPPSGASLAKGGKKKRVDAMKLVLQKFAPAEEKNLKKVTKKILEGLEIILAESPEKAMNFLNQN